MGIRSSYMAILFALAWGATSFVCEQKSPVDIDIWYGSEQRFGHLGEPQRWINVLGQISPADRVADASYSINDRDTQALSLGCDLHRLAMPGDFNVQLGWDEVNKGKNELRITAYDNNGTAATTTVILYVEKGNRWALPYQIDFGAVADLQDVVQVVDGQWDLVDDGVRTKQKYYDRVLTMGDSSWKNFETVVSLTIHDWTPSEPGPPTFNVSHFGVAMRWRGHHLDGRQPSRKWYPLGAQGEFLLKHPTDSCQWRILFDGGKTGKPKRYARERNQLDVGKPMQVRTQIKTMEDGRSRYRFKQWHSDRSEPIHWDVEGYETGDYPSGALCLVPHNSDVTIHSVSVRPLLE